MSDDRDLKATFENYFNDPNNRGKLNQLMTFRSSTPQKFCDSINRCSISNRMKEMYRTVYWNQSNNVVGPLAQRSR